VSFLFTNVYTNVVTVSSAMNDPATLNNTNRQTTTILNANDPALAGFRITRIILTPGVSALIEWNSVAGKTYRVQYRNSLNASSWADLPGDVTATTNTASKVDTTIAGATERYYRVALVTSVPSPSLSITRTNSNQALIAWPSTTPADFILETTTNLTPVIVWVTVTNAPAVVGTNKTVLLNLEPQTPSRFFRLRQ
jgi:hypothetical protein